MSTLRYGILSTASIVPRFLAALRESGTGEAVAIASRSEEKAAEKAREWNIPQHYGSYEALLADPELDVIYVAPINSAHFAYSKMALEKGHHVICEKPLTLRAADAQELFALAREKKRFLAEAEKSVFLPVMADIKALLDSGKLGRVQFLDFTSSCDPQYNDWLHSRAAGGGALYGNASYALHLLPYLLDREISAYSGLGCFGQSEVVEQCALNLRLGDDILAVSKISTNVLAINRAYIFCDKGYIEIPDYWKARSATVCYRSGEVEKIEHPCDHELIYEIRHFDQCIRGGLLESPIMSENTSVGALRIMESLQDQWSQP